MIENIIKTQNGYRATVDGVELYIPDAPGNRHWQMVQDAIKNGAIIEEEPLPDQTPVVRSKRDLLLSESDWVVIKSTETATAIPEEWLVYRQSLRDITLQDGFPDNIIWPEKPV